MQLQFTQSDFKSEYLFRTCSVAISLVTSPLISFRLLGYYAVPAVLKICAVLPKYGAVLYSPIFTPITALLQAVLQANTETFQNDLVETRKRAIELKNGLGTSLVPVQNVSKGIAVRSNVHFYVKS